MAKCLDCNGTGEALAYEPWEDCPTCDGSGSVDGGWADDDDSYDRDEAAA